MDLITAQYGETIDALPYIDSEYDGMEETVDKLIQQEMQKFSPPDYLSKYKSIEFKGGKTRSKEESIDMTRYELQPLPSNKKNDLPAWKLSIRNAQAQLEHQFLRLENLELMQSYGANSWKSYLSDLEGIHKSLTHNLERLKDQIEEVNLDRKSEQMGCAPTLRNLEFTWMELVQKNLTIEQAISSLETQNQNLKKRKISQETRVD